MDCLDLLIADHNRVRGLFSRFEDSEDPAIVQTIATELEVHTKIEEEIFYPWARQLSPEVDEVVEEGVQEHHVADVLLAEIAELEPGADEWKAKVKVLIENVEHHAEEEEQELFPQVRSASESGDRDAIGIRLEQRKRQLGAPTAADAEGKTKEELLDLASEQAIPGRSSMSVEELRATVDARA